MGTRGFFAGSTVRQSAPGRMLPQCGACGLHRTCKTPKMRVGGQGDGLVLFVGEAPGDKEDTQDDQFIGKAGQYLRRVLRSLDFDLDRDGLKTNAVICRPPKNRKPTPAEVVYCRPNLARAIKDLAPDVIIPMGISAVSAVLGGIWGEDIGKMERWAGWRIPCQALNAWVCPTWHPTHLLREEDPVLDRQFKAHIGAALEKTEPPWPAGPPEWGRNVTRIVSPNKAAAWLRKAATVKSGAIAWDYETNMLKPDWPDARIVSCAVAWGRNEPEKCIAFPWHGAAIKAMGDLLRSPVPKIASNLKFEERWTLKEFGRPVRRWAWDTMLAAHVGDNRPDITSVKFQAFIRLGVPVWNDKVGPFLKTKGDARVNAILREIDIADLLQYNGLDALLEFRVACDQIRELNHPWPWEGVTS